MEKIKGTINFDKEVKRQRREMLEYLENKIVDIIEAVPFRDRLFLQDLIVGVGSRLMDSEDSHKIRG